MSSPPSPTIPHAISYDIDYTNVEQLQALVYKIKETLRLQRGNSMSLYNFLRAEKAANEILLRKLEATEQLNARQIVKLKMALRAEKEVSKTDMAAELERLEALKLQNEKDKKILLALRDHTTEDLIEKHIQLEVELRRKEEELQTVYDLMSLYQKDLNEYQEKEKELTEKLEAAQKEVERLNKTLAEVEKKEKAPGVAMKEHLDKQHQVALDQQEEPKASFEISFREYLKSKSSPRGRVRKGSNEQQEKIKEARNKMESLVTTDPLKNYMESLKSQNPTMTMATENTVRDFLEMQRHYVPIQQNQQRTSFEIPYSEYRDSKNSSMAEKDLIERAKNFPTTQQTKVERDRMEQAALLGPHVPAAALEYPPIKTYFNTPFQPLFPIDQKKLEDHILWHKEWEEKQKNYKPLDEVALKAYLDGLAAAAAQTPLATSSDAASQTSHVQNLINILAPFQAMSTSDAPKAPQEAPKKE